MLYYPKKFLLLVFSIFYNVNVPVFFQFICKCTVHWRHYWKLPHLPYTQISENMIPFFYTESNLRKLLWKPKDWVATRDKNNIVYETDCSNCETIYFGESNRSLKSRLDKHKISLRKCALKRIKLQNTIGKQITTLAG